MWDSDVFQTRDQSYILPFPEHEKQQWLETGNNKIKQSKQTENQ
jgi:hypothetical protein